MRTRIKICGITTIADGLAAANAGADAIGLVFYPKSPRFVDLERAAAIARAMPPFLQVVGLFVNAEAATVRQTLAAVPLSLLQFHGDEDEAYCAQFDRPYLKAARMRPGFDLVQYAASFGSAQALLLDAFVDGYGGGGHAFDWKMIPQGLPRPIVLSGGLDPDNVTTAVRTVRPAAVDVSSGVEVAKGVKDHAKIAAFIAGVRNADV
ncbi:MAG: phosphoribosylanthranilate isomerase [Rhodocyclales bacterium]|nr:phosphoribosylanthranilate isomerase [Rhodocyclales bacterium]